MNRARLWFLVGSVLLSGCLALPRGAADPAATEAAIEAAVAATGTAIAATAPTPPPLVAAPVTQPPATLAPSPRPLVTAATPAASPTVTGAAPVTPSPAVTRVTQPLTSDEAAYLRSVVPFIRQFNQSFDRFVELVGDPKPEDASWRLSLGAELQLWADGAEAARGVRPPETMLPIHRQVIAGLDSYRDASRQITEALQQGNSEQVRQGLDSVQKARRAFNEASLEIERLAQARGL
ncbi:MAG: hypothetical protein IT340_12775 [Chloroflexi bacterium]|nr:hypothetical protein [Chloroflexota bacterium]